MFIAVMDTVSQKAIGHFSAFEHQSVGILYFIFGVIGVVTNGLLFLAFLREPAINSPSRILHLNLAIANILVCAGFPFSGSSSFRGRWLFGEAGCQAYGMESFGGGIAAVTFVLVLCIERYLASCKRDFYNSMSGSTWTLVSVLCWLYGLVWGMFPLFGWSSYAVEPSGTACGVDWVKKDANHTSYLVTLTFVTFVMMALAAYCLQSARGFWDNSVAVPIVDPKQGHEQSWFSEKQLVWISIAFFAFLLVGWGPYGYFAMWASYTDAQNVTVLAVTLPPLFAKGSVSLYALPYLVASDKFRQAFIGQRVTEEETKKQ